MERETVRTWMTPDPITIQLDRTVLEAFHIMKSHNIRRLPVLNGAELIGIITINDVRGLAPMGAFSILEHSNLVGNTPVARAMTPNPIVVSPEESIGEAARILMLHKFGGLPVVEDGALVGVISEADIFRLLIADTWQPLKDSTLEEDGEEWFRLHSGEEIRIRPIRPGDAARLQEAFNNMSYDTRYDRFLSSKQFLPDSEARQLAALDYAHHMALVAAMPVEGDEQILAVARYTLLDAEPDTGEFAVVVADGYQKRGLGAHLMKRLMEYAHAHGVKTFLGITQPQNNRLQRLVARSGLPVAREIKDGLLELRITLGENPYPYAQPSVSLQTKST